MKPIDTYSLRDEVKEMLLCHLDEVCAELNNKYEDLRFYVKGNGIFVDCSDYSPRDVEIFSI